MYKLAVAGHPQQTRTVVVKEKETERGKYISQSVSQSIRSATLSLPEEGNRQRERERRVDVHCTRVGERLRARHRVLLFGCCCCLTEVACLQHTEHRHKDSRFPSVRLTIQERVTERERERE